MTCTVQIQQEKVYEKEKKEGEMAMRKRIGR
jgi:hypothetical protein